MSTQQPQQGNGRARDLIERMQGRGAVIDRLVSTDGWVTLPGGERAHDLWGAGHLVVNPLSGRVYHTDAAAGPGSVARGGTSVILEIQDSWRWETLWARLAAALFEKVLLPSDVDLHGRLLPEQETRKAEARPRNSLALADAVTRGRRNQAPLPDYEAALVSALQSAVAQGNLDSLLSFQARLSSMSARPYIGGGGFARYFYGEGVGALLVCDPSRAVFELTLFPPRISPDGAAEPVVPLARLDGRRGLREVYEQSASGVEHVVFGAEVSPLAVVFIHHRLMLRELVSSGVLPVDPVRNHRFPSDAATVRAVLALKGLDLPAEASC